jgi:hypothetical protein
MKKILQSMDSLTPQLKELEKQMTSCEFTGKSATELLGPNPQAGFSKLVEFKAALDRMRGLTWVFMETAVSTGKFPAQRMPPALRQFLHQQASKTESGHGRTKAG